MRINSTVWPLCLAKVRMVSVKVKHLSKSASMHVGLGSYVYSSDVSVELRNQLHDSQKKINKGHAFLLHSGHI